MATIYRGQDIDIQITVRDDTTLVPVDLADFAGILFYLYQGENRKTVVERYSLNALADHEDLTIIEATSGIFECRLQASITKNLSEGKLWGEVKVAETDAELEDGLLDTIASKIDVGTIDDSVTKLIAVP